MKKTHTAAKTSTRKQVLLLVAAAAALIVAIVVARRSACLSIPLVDPVVSLERQQSADSSSARIVSTPSNLPDEGEVYRTADRLREASAVALAAALYAADEQVNRRHTLNVESVIAGIQSAGLLPPGVSVDGPAMLQSRFARLSLRFRSEPLGIEVLSQPQSREDGPALMVRIPGSGTEGETGSVFIADRLGDINAPVPFASISDCVRAGWIDQAINQTETPKEQEQQLRVWLATRRPR